MSTKSPGLLNIWQSLLLVILPVCVAVAVYWFVGLPMAAKQSAESQARMVAEVKAAALDNSFELLASQLEGMSRLSSLRQALLDDDHQTLSVLSKEWSLMFANVNRMLVLPLGELGVADLGAYRDQLRNNIEKDIVRRATSNERVVVDVYQLDGSYVVSLARAVNAGNRKVGALLLSLDSSWLKTQLEAMQSETSQSAIEATTIQYQVARSPAVDILSDRRMASEVIASSKAGLNISENIFLRYDLGAAPAASMVVVLLICALFAGCALLALLALIRVSGIMSRFVDEDTSRLKRYLGEFFENSPSVPTFKFSAFDSVIEGVVSAYSKFSEKQAMQKPDLEVGDSTENAQWEAPSTAPKLVVEEDDHSPLSNSELEGAELSVPRHIFRAYDIRGIAEQDLQDKNVSLIGAAIGTTALNAGSNRVVVARDGRLSSERIAAALIEGLVSTGCDVVDIGLTPTPVLYFATEHLQTGSGCDGDRQPQWARIQWF